MDLNRDGLDQFEAILKELYTTAFFTENLKGIVAPTKSAFITSCNNDYNNAQNGIASNILKLYDQKKLNAAIIKKCRQVTHRDNATITTLIDRNKIIANRILVLRRLQDAIAFRLFDNKVWISKRFVLRNGIAEPDIQAIVENVQAARQFNNDEGVNFALVPDITTFINVGDLIVRRPYASPKWLVVELKTGSVNRTLFDLLNKEEGEREKATSAFDKATEDQWKRILGQKEKTNQIIDFVKNSGGKDVATGIDVKLLD